MFQVGDIVKYISEIREGPDWIGYVINIDHNGYTKYLKVIFFNDCRQHTFCCSKFMLMS